MTDTPHTKRITNFIRMQLYKAIESYTVRGEIVLFENASAAVIPASLVVGLPKIDFR